MAPRPRRWRPWLQLALLGVAVSTLATSLLLLESALGARTSEGTIYQLPTRFEFIQLFGTLPFVGLLSSGIIVFPTLIVTRLMVAWLGKMDLTARCLIAAIMGMLWGVVFSTGLYFLFGGWGNMFVVPSVAAGTVVGPGWAWLLRHEMIRKRSGGDSRMFLPEENPNSDLHTAIQMELDEDQVYAGPSSSPRSCIPK